MRKAAQKLKRKKEHSGLASMLELLISMGHVNAHEYSPRRIVAFSELAAHRKKQELATTLAVHALAAQGDNKAIKKQINQLEK